MEAYYDEGDYPLPKIVAPEMEAQVVQSNYCSHNILTLLNYEPYRLEYLRRTGRYRKELDELIYSGTSSMKIAYRDTELCRLTNVKISMAINTSIKIMKMSTKELLVEYRNLE